MLLTTPLYQALHKQFPDVEVDTLIYKETTPLLQNNPHLNRVLCIDRKLKGFARLKAEVGLLFQIRKLHYDAVIHLTDQWVGAAVAYFSNAPIRVQMAFAKRDKTLWHNCFTHRTVPPPRGQMHAVQINLLCMEAFGVDPEKIQGEMVLHTSSENLRLARELLTAHGIDKPFVLIHPAARWPFKCWEDKKFADVVVHLLRKGLHVVLTCSPDPVELAMTAEIEQLARRDIGDSRGTLVNVGGTMSLQMLAALLKLSKFYVGVDSAPMHMAAALNVPQVALFGPSWVQEWRPWSNKAIVIYAGDFGALPHPDSIDTQNPTRLLGAIPTDAVISAVDKLVN